MHKLIQGISQAVHSTVIFEIFQARRFLYGIFYKTKQKTLSWWIKMKSFLSLLESSWRLNYKKHENKSPGSRSPMKEQFNMGPMTWFTVFLGIAWPQITLSLHIEGNSWDFSFIPHSLAIAFCATHCSPDNVQSHKTVPNIIIIWFQLLLFFFMLSKFPVILNCYQSCFPTLHD